MTRWKVVLLAWMVLGAAPLRAQAVAGTLVSVPAGAPVSGALVTLLDGGGVAVDTAQSDAEGRFALKAPGAGGFQVRAERVGYATSVSPTFSLTAGEVREVRLETAPAVAMLDELRVTAPDRQCVIDPRGGIRTAALWEEARKSLALAEWARKRNTFLYTLRKFEREVDPERGEVRRDTAVTEVSNTVTPYVSLPAEELARGGYVRLEEEGTVYYSPDAAVLLSDAFLDGHCFRVRLGDAGEVVGLAFEPVRGRKLPDVRGVIWLDARTAELRSLEYSYTGLRQDLSIEREWGGRLHFERLPDGPVIVRRWDIFMPVVGGTVIGARRVRARVVAIREEGAEVLSVAPSPADGP